MGETTDHILAYSYSLGGFSTSYQLLGNIWLQDGGVPSWNILTPEGQVFWPCSRPEIMYYEGLIMAAMYFSDRKSIKQLVKKVYGNNPRKSGLGARPEDPNYAKLVEAVKIKVSNMRFTIVSLYSEIPLGRLDQVDSFEFEVRIAPSLDMERYRLLFKKDQ
jgi:hypothetical protein